MVGGVPAFVLATLAREELPVLVALCSVRKARADEPRSIVLGQNTT